MKFRKRTLFLILFLIPFKVLAQDKASLPYQTVWQYLDLFDTMAQLDQVKPSMNISSVDPSVSISDIEFRIHVDGQWRNFTLDETGALDVPREPLWNERKLVLLSNQPKGTLQLVIGFSARPLPGNPVPYQHLVTVQNQFQQAMELLAKETGQSPPGIKGLTLIMPAGAGLTIESARPKAMKPNSVGIINLAYDARLEKENPPVAFDQLPLGIVPLQKSGN